MYFKRTLLLIVCLSLPVLHLHAAVDSYTNPNLNLNDLTDQLYKELDSGDIFAGSFDKQAEMQIARTELQLARAHLADGNRKLAVILGVEARKTMQRALGDPYNPAMIPIYSTLVELYDGVYEKNSPLASSADPEKAKMYREAIDHIHAR